MFIFIPTKRIKEENAWISKVKILMFIKSLYLQVSILHLSLFSFCDSNTHIDPFDSIL